MITAKEQEQATLVHVRIVLVRVHALLASCDLMFTFWHALHPFAYLYTLPPPLRSSKLQTEQIDSSCSSAPLGALNKPGMGALKKPGMNALKKPGMNALEKPGMDALEKPGMNALPYPQPMQPNTSTQLEDETGSGE
jgi:hypothetical protein